jgi:hypothetical protein
VLELCASIYMYGGLHDLLEKKGSTGYIRCDGSVKEYVYMMRDIVGAWQQE